MIRSFVGLGVLFLACAALFTHWSRSLRAHNRRLDKLAVRLHVNGIRGKSTVTRLLAGVLREGGYVTVAKTTGSAARVLSPSGAETPIKRRGAPTINEQVDVVSEYVTPEVEALVIECMAVRPLYQQYSQDHMVRSHITVITNVREDHQDEMGETLEEIADSLCSTIPVNGVLVTSEERPHLRERLARNASARNTELIYADPRGVSAADMRGFDYLQFKENVAIGLVVARLLGVSRDAALQGMWRSVPDVGVVRLRTYPVRGVQVMWVPMFAANDRESVVMTLSALRGQFPPNAPVIGVLNNRGDRGRRAELFADMVPQDLADQLDHVITFGAYEKTVIPRMIEQGYPADRVHAMGDTVQPTLDQILDLIGSLACPGGVVLVGMINIHTAQAEMLIDYFAERAGDEHVDEVEQSRQLEKAPSGTRRMNRAAARRPTPARRTKPDD